MTEIATPTRTDDEITAYKDYVNALSENNSSEIFRNSGPKYASIVFGNIFKSSNEIVRIFSGKMSKIVTDNPFYYENLKNFVEKGGRIQLILEKDQEDTESSAFQYLYYKSQLYPDQVKIRKGAGLRFFLGSEEQNNKTFIHFATGDNSKYRIEIEKDNHKALCCMNNKENTKTLNDLFDNTFATFN